MRLYLLSFMSYAKSLLSNCITMIASGLKLEYESNICQRKSNSVEYVTVTTKKKTKTMFKSWFCTHEYS